MNDQNRDSKNRTAEKIVNAEIEWRHVGKVKDPHGLKGDLEILIFSKDSSWVGRLKDFRLAGIRYQVERAKPFKEGLLLKAIGISDRNASEALKGAAFEVPADLFVSAKGETIYLSEILGFEVLDRGVVLGAISKFSSNGPQDLLVVPWCGREVEIPFVAPFLERIDFEKRQVFMDLPEGLMDLVVETKRQRPKD